jgi:hypothetical protein
MTQLDPKLAHEFRKGGLHDKYDPACTSWRVPKVYCWGVSEKIRQAFDVSDKCEWAVILMDRVIEDIFT